jgi:hypothetical protein
MLGPAELEETAVCVCGHDESAHSGWTCLAKVGEASVCPCPRWTPRVTGLREPAACCAVFDDTGAA